MRPRPETSVAPAVPDGACINAVCMAGVHVARAWGRAGPTVRALTARNAPPMTPGSGESVLTRVGGFHRVKRLETVCNARPGNPVDPWGWHNVVVVANAQNEEQP